jgi:hypothetical protein
MSALQMSTVKIEFHQPGSGQRFRKDVGYELA